MIVILSQNNLSKNKVIVVGLNDTISVMKYLITSKNQWSDYMKEILHIININYYE